MSQAILTISQVEVKGYHEFPFDVEIGKRFVAQKVIDDRGQLGHLQREIALLWSAGSPQREVAPLWPLRNEILV